MPLAAVLLLGILTMWIPARWALTGFQLALFGLAAARIATRWRHGLALTTDTGAWLLAAAAIWGAVQATANWSVDQFRTLDEVLNWTTYAVAFSLALETGGRARAGRRFLNTVLWVGLAVAVLAMITVFASPPGVIAWRFDTGTGVATLGPFVYRNQFAAFIEVILPLALFRGLAERERAWLYLGAAGVLFASVVAAGSRAGAALCGAELVAVPALAWFRGLVSGRRLAGIVLAGGLGLGALAAASGWDPLWNRFQEADPYALRANLLRSSWAMVRDRPLTGFGLGTWAEAYPGYALFDDGLFVNQAHNDWAQWAAEGGIPLLLIMLWFAGRTIKPAASSIWGLGIVAVFLHCLVDYPMQQRPALAAFFFAVAGLVLGSVRAVTREHPNV